MVDTVDGMAWSRACENNKGPILHVIRELFSSPARVLEIGTGTGQHAVYFATHLPHLNWQPCDQVDWHPESAERLRREAPANVAPIRALDVCCAEHWAGVEAEHVYSANTAHFMPWNAVSQMFAGVARVLTDSGLFVLYGPFNENGRFTSDSNAAFDLRLKERDPEFGIRDIAELDALASVLGMHLQARHPMPANNQILVFSRH